MESMDIDREEQEDEKDIDFETAFNRATGLLDDNLGCEMVDAIFQVEGINQSAAVHRCPQLL